MLDCHYCFSVCSTTNLLAHVELYPACAQTLKKCVIRTPLFDIWHLATPSQAKITRWTSTLSHVLDAFSMAFYSHEASLHIKDDTASGRCFVLIQKVDPHASYKSALERTAWDPALPQSTTVMSTRSARSSVVYYLQLRCCEEVVCQTTVAPAFYTPCCSPLC